MHQIVRFFFLELHGSEGNIGIGVVDVEVWQKGFVDGGVTVGGVRRREKWQCHRLHGIRTKSNGSRGFGMSLRTRTCAKKNGEDRLTGERGIGCDVDGGQR